MKSFALVCSRLPQLLIALLTLPILFLAGCGSGLVQVAGTVLVDGQPAEGVMLIFHPLGDNVNALPATTTTGPDGSFSLTTNLESGIQKGSYKVTATWPDPKHKAVAVGFSEPEPAPDLLKGRFSGTSSAMTTEINGSMQDLKIELATNK